MNKFFGKVRDFPYAIGAAVTLAIMSVSSGAAAQTASNIGDAATGLRTQVGQIGNLALAGGFVGGIVMIAAGLMKLKQAADTQGQQVKYGEGMWRLGVGAGLVAIPALAGMGTASFGLGSPDTTGVGFQGGWGGGN